MLGTNGHSTSNINLPIQPLPIHVAIIMDGNGRWATQRGLPRLKGHQAGTENVKRIIKAFTEYGISYLTLYAFSTENWNRPNEEVFGLMDLLHQVVRKEVNKLHLEGVRIRHLGRLDRLSMELKTAINDAIELTKNNTVMNLNVAFDYGGRSEIINAVKKLVLDKINPNKITEELFQSYLYSADIPNPDLIVRTGGEMRISNFLLWQSAYSEYYSTPKTWPEFDESEVKNALIAYSHRHRRFGKVEQ